MRVRLLQPLYLDGKLWPARAEISLPPAVRPNVFMEGLDAEAVAAIAEEKIRVYGRWIGRGRNRRLLDNPPIERPDITNAQPVPTLPAGGPGR